MPNVGSRRRSKFQISSHKSAWSASLKMIVKSTFVSLKVVVKSVTTSAFNLWLYPLDKKPIGRGTIGLCSDRNEEL